MKLKSVFLIIILNAVFVFAFYDDQTCKQRLKDNAWPKDKFKFVLSCKLETQLKADLHKDLCVAAILTERSVYKKTEVYFLAFTPDSHDMHRDLITLDENNDAAKSTKFYTEDDQLVFESQHSNFMMSLDWTHQYKGSFTNNSLLYYKSINERYLLPDDIIEEGQYKCQQEN